MKFEFFEISKNCNISMGNSEKTVEVIEEMRPEINSMARNPQENVI